jgi:hypothetical protein
MKKHKMYLERRIADFFLSSRSDKVAYDFTTVAIGVQPTG